MKNKIAVAILLTVALAVTGCGSGGSDATENTTASQEGINSDLKSANESSQEVFAMDTYMTVTAYGKNAKKAVDASIEEIKRLDALLSTGDEDSEIAKLNVNKSATLSEDGGYLVQRGIELSTMTDGAFDIAIYPVMQEWGFPTKDFKVPDDVTLKELLKLADVSKIDYDNKSREISFDDAGMRHVENIWKTEELAWSVGIVTDSHGCPLSSEHYKSMVGKTIKNVTYYTSKGIFTLPVDYKVLEHAKDAAVEVENAAVSAGKANLDVTLPDDFNAEYAVTDAKGNEVKGFKVTEENLASAVSTYAASYTQTNKLVITYPKDAENTEYTLTVSDKSNKYAPITTTFELYADAVSAAYNNDATAPKLVVADGASAAQFADFIGKIKSVNVNGKDYPATGKGAVKLIKEDGTIDTTQAPFAEGSSFEIKVSATGYKEELSFTYEKPAVIETKALESVIEKADTLKEADYTADSWKTFSQVLSSAKAVLKQKDDQTKVDNAVASLNKAIEGLKKKEVVNPGTPGSGAGSTGAISGGTGSSNGADTKAAVATGSKSNSTTTDTTGTAAKKATVKKASKTGDTNPLMGMLALAFASISLVGAALFAKKPNRK